MERKSRFATLDGLRGIAALAVVTRHVPDLTLVNWSQGTTLAVDLFFVLSGFVLMHAYSSRLTDKLSPFAFFKLRIARLYPLYALGTLLVLAVLLQRGHIGDENWWRTMGSVPFAALFLPTPPGIHFVEHAYPLNFPAWSLFYELIVNILFAVLIFRMKGAFLVAVLLTGAAALAASLLYFGDLTSGSLWSNFWGGAPRVWFSFFAGVAVYRLWVSGRFSWGISAPVAMAILVATFLLEPERGRDVYDFLTVVLVYPILVLLAANREPHGVFWPICEQLGAASYAIYVLQIPVILWSEGLVRRLTGYELASFGVAGSIGLIILVTIVSLAADRYFDLPARAFLARVIGGAARRKPSVAP